MDWTWGWAAIGALATCFLALGIGTTAWQIREARRRARAEFTEKRLEELNTQDMKEALEISYEKAPLRIDDLTADEQIKVRQLLEHMQVLGMLVEKGHADKELAVVAHRGKFIRCWCRLKYMICHERQKRGKYCEGVEYLAKEAYKYQNDKKLPKDEWVKIDGETCVIDVNETCESIISKEKEVANP